MWVQSKPADVDVEAVTAAVEQELDAQEWNMQEIERQQQAQVHMRVWAWLNCDACCIFSSFFRAAFPWRADYQGIVSWGQTCHC